MRQCNNIEEAFHYDCVQCDEINCEARKTPLTKSGFFVFCLFLIALLFTWGYLLFEVL